VLNRIFLSTSRITNPHVWLLLGFITLITFYPIFGIGFTTGDEILYYELAYKKNIWSTSFDFAKDSGRFYLTLTNPLYIFPYLFDNIVITKCIQYGSLFFCIFSFGLLIKKLVKSFSYSILFLTIFLTFVSISKWTSLIICYSFYFTFSFTLLLWAVIFLQKYLEQQKKKYLYISTGLYFSGLLFYEVYLLYLLIIAIIIFANHKNISVVKFSLKNYLKTMAPFIGTALVYLTMYLTFYLMYPSNYIGTKPGLVSLEKTVTLLSNYSESAFPLSAYYQHQSVMIEGSESITGFKNNFTDMAFKARPEWLIKAALVSILFLLMLYRLPSLRFRNTLPILATAFILLYFSHLLFTLSQKYTSENNINAKGYVTTFFSYFGIVLFMTAMVDLIFSYAQKNIFTKYLFAGLCTIYIFTCSIKNSYANYFIAKDMKRIQLNFNVIDEFCKTSEFKALPENSVIYAEDLFINNSTVADVFLIGFHWKRYIQLKTSRSLNICKDIRSFQVALKEYPSAPLFYILKNDALNSEESVLVVAPLDSFLIEENHFKPYTNKATLYYYSSYKNFGLNFSSMDRSKEKQVMVNAYKAITQDVFFAYQIQGKNKNDVFTTVEMKVPLMDINSISVSNIPLKNKPVVLSR
jgi:hypothetical protein